MERNVVPAKSRLVEILDTLAQPADSPAEVTELEDESISFSDWFTSWLSGEMPEDVWCTDC